MTRTTVSKLARLSSLLGAAMMLALPAVARADASCNAVMAEHFNWDANGPANLIRFQNAQFLYIKDNGAWSMWSSGQLYWNGGVGGDKLQSLSPLQQYFSDRQSGGQPFTDTATDQTTIQSVTADGVITMWNDTWGFSSTVNATCSDHTMIAHSGDGTLILTVNDGSTRR